MNFFPFSGHAVEVGRDESCGITRGFFEEHAEWDEEPMKKQTPLIAVVDDDESIRESLPDLLGELGFDAYTFSSAEEFLASGYVGQTSCLILDIAMPGMSGPELQRELAIRQRTVPIIFITAQRDDNLRPHLLKLGAVECLLKPFSEAELIRALDTALQLD
jgi:FixJ family two-component response regulator